MGDPPCLLVQDQKLLTRVHNLQEGKDSQLTDIPRIVSRCSLDIYYSLVLLVNALNTLIFQDTRLQTAGCQVCVDLGSTCCVCNPDGPRILSVHR